MEAIDPTEILVGKSRQIPSVASAPWVRLFARLFDYSLFCTVLWAIHFSLVDRYEHWIPWELFAWIPIETCLLSLWGQTPGKWLLKVTLSPPLRFEQALKRSFAVWMRGIGMGIPVLNVFCLFIAYQRLQILKTTSWDRDCKTAISYGHVSRTRFLFTAIFAIFGLLFYTSRS